MSPLRRHDVETGNSLHKEVAGDPMVAAVAGNTGGQCIQAAIHPLRTARIEGASVHAAAVFPFLNRLYLVAPATRGIGFGNGIDKQLRVRVLRITEHHIHRAALHLRSLVEDVDVVANLIGRAEVVGDVKEGDSLFIAHA